METSKIRVYDCSRRCYDSGRSESRGFFTGLAGLVRRACVDASKKKSKFAQTGRRFGLFAIRAGRSFFLAHFRFPAFYGGIVVTHSKGRLSLVCTVAVGLLVPSTVALGDARDHKSRELLQEVVSEADQITDEKIRAAAQWKLVRPLVESGLEEQAFEQAMKLQNVNPHTCILSLAAIAREDKAQDSRNRDRAVNLAINVDQQAEFRYTNYVIDMIFRLKRDPEEAIKVASAASRNSQARAFGSIRDWLARTGRVDQAYEVAREYLADQPEIHHHRQIGYSCASVKHYDYFATHDYFGQTIEVIKKMPQGKERDFVIGQLVSNLMYTTGEDKVSDEHLQLAAHWAEQIQDDAGRGAARHNIVRKKAPETIEDMEKQFASATLREEKNTLLTRIFRKLLADGKVDEADKILPRKLKLIEEQPREKQVSAFGVFDDAAAVRSESWTHHRLMVDALLKAGRVDDAKKRVDEMKNLPDGPPIMFIGNLDAIRQQLYLKMEAFDDLKQLIAEKFPNEPQRIHLLMTDHWIQKDDLDKALEEFEPVLQLPTEKVFPPEKVSYFSATLHERLARKLAEADRLQESIRVISSIPEHERLTEPFAAFGRVVGNQIDIDQVTEVADKMPHQTSKTFFLIGAWQSIKSKKWLFRRIGG